MTTYGWHMLWCATIQLSGSHTLTGRLRNFGFGSPLHTSGRGLISGILPLYKAKSSQGSGVLQSVGWR